MDMRDDTCFKCNTNQGVWECANCREIPLCDECVEKYRRNNWAGYGCFCCVPKHEMCRIESVDDFIDDEDDEA